MLIDTHAHLQGKKFAVDQERVLERARDAGVDRLVCIADDLETSRQAIALAKRRPYIFATAGLHPAHERRFQPEMMADLRRLASDKRVVAIGEIGLDFHYPDFRRDKQIEVFLSQALLASELGKPMVIHCRDAYRALIDLFRSEPRVTSRGVVHCFSGDTDEALALIDMGFYLGFGGAITYPNAGPLRATLRRIGLDRVVLETDAPYLPPQKKRGRRNEPSYLKHTAAELAELTGMTYQDVARITTANACALYGLRSPSRAELAYGFRRRVYLNLTNRCTNECCHCARNSDYMLYGHYLKLTGEPSAEELLAALGENLDHYEECVICGLGEPTLRLDVVLELARELKRRGRRVRLNTNGHGNLIHGRNIAPDLTGLIDSVTVTMNAHDQATYNEISCPADPERSFEAMLDFTREARKCVPDVRLKVLAAPGVDVEACRRIAEDEIKVRFQAREWRLGPVKPATCGAT